MTTLTSSTEATAPTFRLRSRLPMIRGLVVFCLSALIAVGFVFDVAGGARRSTAPEAHPAALATS